MIRSALLGFTIGLVLCTGLLIAEARATETNLVAHQTGAPRTVPCARHTATTPVTRTRCLAAYRATVRARLKARALVRRDRAAWPPLPITDRDLAVRGVNVAGFVRLARCEAGLGSGHGGARWTTPAGWVYQGGLGMWWPHLTAGHPYGTNAGALPWRAQVLIGHVVARRYGLSAWEAYRDNPGPCWYG